MSAAWLTLLAFVLDPAAFREMARQSDSAGVVILQQGQPVVEITPNKRVHVQSVSKVMLSLAAGLLHKDGKLPSLDITLGEALPPLKGDPKEKVTLRQLLAHVSGVAHLWGEKSNNSRQFQSLRDTRAYALAQPLEDAPGTRRRYNNTGMILTVAMLESLAGEPLPRYLEKRLFQPLGIRSADWMKDRAGHAYGYMGLVIDARDLARIGQLVLNEGAWEGRQLIDREWLRESTRKAPYPELSANQALVWVFQGYPPAAEPFLISHSGDGGNWLLIFPDLNLVAVRLRDAAAEDPVNFPKLVYENFR